jgi:Flp pilus assembly pilin Flp
MMRAFANMIRDDGAAAMVEYAIIAAGIALPIIAIGVAISAACGVTLNQTATGLTSLGQSPP